MIGERRGRSSWSEKGEGGELDRINRMEVEGLGSELARLTGNKLICYTYSNTFKHGVKWTI